MNGITTLRPEDTRAIITLKSHRKELTWQQYTTLRGQIFTGNTVGAMKGLRKILRKRGKGE